MTDDIRALAGARLSAALEAAAMADPRDEYRAMLQRLKARDAAAFARLVRFFEEELAPAVAGGEDPVAAWLDYGRRVARAFGPGRELEIGPSGRALPPADRPGPGLLLYLPDDGAQPALVLAAPRAPSRPQQATLELLVRGRVSASVYERSERSG